MKEYNLETRTLQFAKEVIIYCKGLKSTHLNGNIITQLLRSSQSIGANYREACETDLKKDFANKIRIIKKEARETEYWLELLTHVDDKPATKIQELINESRELMKIFASIYLKSK